MTRFYQPNTLVDFNRVLDKSAAKFKTENDVRPFEMIILDAIANNKFTKANKDFNKIHMVFDEHSYDTEFAQKKYGKDSDISKVVGPNSIGSLNYLGVLYGSPDRSLDEFFAIIYHDGRSIRAYIPTNGNTWDVDSKEIWDKSLGRNPRKFDVGAMFLEIKKEFKERDVATTPKRVAKPKAAPVSYDIDALEARLNEGVIPYTKVPENHFKRTFTDIVVNNINVGIVNGDIYKKDFMEIARFCVGEASPRIISDASKVDFGNQYIAVNPGEILVPELNDVLGVQTIGDFTFVGVAAGMRWQYPVYFILYIYENEIRAYVPNRGNSWDLKKMCAWGGALGTEKGYNKKNPREFDATEIINDITKRFDLKV